MKRKSKLLVSKVVIDHIRQLENAVGNCKNRTDKKLDAHVAKMERKIAELYAALEEVKVS